MSIKTKIERKKVFGMVLPEWMDEEVLKKLVYSVLGLIFALLMSILFIWPRFSGVINKEKKVRIKEETRDGLLGAVSRLDKVDLVNDTAGVERLELSIPGSFRPDYILVSLKDLSRRSLVSIESYVFEGGGVVSGSEEEEQKSTVQSAVESKSEKIKGHKVSLSVAGLSSNLIKFVNNLENTLPFSTVADMSISQISRVISSEDMSRLEMKLEFYELPEIEVGTESIAELSGEELALFEEIKDWYKPGNLIQQDGDLGLPTGRSSGLFGN